MGAGQTVSKEALAGQRERLEAEDEPASEEAVEEAGEAAGVVATPAEVTALPPASTRATSSIA